MCPDHMKCMIFCWNKYNFWSQYISQFRIMQNIKESIITKRMPSQNKSNQTTYIYEINYLCTIQLWIIEFRRCSVGMQVIWCCWSGAFLCAMQLVINPSLLCPLTFKNVSTSKKTSLLIICYIWLIFWQYQRGWPWFFPSIASTNHFGLVFIY